MKSDELGSIKIHKDTLLRLKELKHQGQSIDGFINEMITYYSTKNELLDKLFNPQKRGK